MSSFLSPNPSSGDPNAAHDFHRARNDRRPGHRPIGFHVTLRLADDRPIASGAEALRTVARVVLTQGDPRGLVAFGTADNHLHAELLTDRASAGAFANYVASALRWHLALGAPFERARIRPLFDQRHAYNTFHYAHRQDTRHDLRRDPAREGTSLSDLLGLRVFRPYIMERVRAHLPRVRREEMLAHFPAAPLDDDGGPIEVELLRAAAAAAFALAQLEGRSIEVTRARRAAVHAAGPDVSSRRIGECLGIGLRAVQSLRSHERDVTAIRAVEKQVRLLHWLRSSSALEANAGTVAAR